MKTLYESILDDEEVLIGDVKKSTNPFVMIYTLLNNSRDIRDDFKTQMEIKKIFNKYLAEGLPYETTSNIRFRFQPDFFSIYTNKLSYNEDLITITQNNLEAAKELNTHKGDNIAILFLDDKAFRKQVKEYGFSNPKHYRDWKDYIATKYKLNKSKDNYIYTI
jgi:hypothetical protein